MYNDFSVLISVYYKEIPEFFDASLSSVINQTKRPTQIVLIKDGLLSQELEEVIEKHTNVNPELFKIISFKNNLGLGKALAYGVEACDYELIFRMDTDDICVPSRFEKQIKVFQTYKDISLVGTSISEFTGTPNNPIAKKSVPETNEKIIQYSKRRNPFNHMTVAFKKQAVLNSGNYIEMLYNEDYYLWARMLKHGYKAMNIPEILVHVRANNELYERRGGVKYLITESKLQLEFVKMKHIPIYYFITNMLVRIIVRTVPSKLRKKFYLFFLRN